ncbi:hypothetical protein [Sphingorhabdus sp.]|uniref:hypothetical protein n=1 Tax=Sphingorhabdus sp. TaxID=1902408 RepID=UPI00359466CF
MDWLRGTCHFIHQPLYILSGCAAAEEASMAEMSNVYDETGRELYIGGGDREHD